jgi:hypothetical protein
LFWGDILTIKTTSIIKQITIMLFWSRVLLKANITAIISNKMMLSMLLPLSIKVAMQTSTITGTFPYQKVYYANGINHRIGCGGIESYASDIVAGAYKVFLKLPLI